MYSADRINAADHLPLVLFNSLSRRVEIDRSRLIFNRIEVEDAGEYECFARNAVANSSSTAEVIVSADTGAAAQSASHANEQRAHVGAAVQLSCSSGAKLKLRVTWTKDGGPLPRSVIRRPDGSLYIRLAQRTDSGRYVCDVRDPYGRRTSNHIDLHIDGQCPADGYNEKGRCGTLVLASKDAENRDTALPTNIYLK
ncbi:hypothetical protein evm_015237 [Chilo suppressalis]|nr:hypothetical protein evm_015237 [Chilo suppressalis]